jgi:hypothetical protein
VEVVTSLADPSCGCDLSIVSKTPSPWNEKSVKMGREGRVRYAEFPILTTGHRSPEWKEWKIRKIGKIENAQLVHLS